jgi:hypothetical protein
MVEPGESVLHFSVKITGQPIALYRKNQWLIKSDPIKFGSNSPSAAHSRFKQQLPQRAAQL